jgi:hypothetical protein
MAISIQMVEYGSTMATRQRGAELRSKVLDIAGDATHLVLDFRGVLSVSSSFADEFVGRLFTDEDRVGEERRRIEIVNAGEGVQRIVNSVINRRRGITPPPAADGWPAAA